MNVHLWIPFNEVIALEKNNIAITITGVTKKYRLGQIGGGTLQADFQSWLAKKRGKEDPNSKIGSESRIEGKDFWALNGIDLTVYKGEALGIIGANGAGKSTLLKLLSRITAPTQGELDIYGRITSMLEVGTGFNGEMTGRENVYMNGAILGMTKAEIDSKMEAIIDFSEVREFIDTPVKRYSSGMYVKLAFSVAAHLDSEIVIMDEVLAVGDSSFQRKCLDKMRSLAKEQGRTVLYVSHNMNTIRALCDRCIVLQAGRIIFDGDVNRAISIYMEDAIQEGTFFDYSSYKRYPHLSQALEFKSLRIMNYETNCLEEGNTLDLFLHCVARDSINNLYIRIEVHSADGMIVGTAISNKCINAKKAQELSVESFLDISNLTPGLYNCSIVSFLCDEFGHQSVVDLVENALSFTIIESSQKGIIWLSQYWGHVQLNDLIVKKVSTI